MARTDSRPRLRLDPDARREAILRSAAAAFAERPYAEVTLADVAEGARTSTPLVYRYFHSKEDHRTSPVMLGKRDLLGSSVGSGLVLKISPNRFIEIPIC